MSDSRFTNRLDFESSLRKLQLRLISKKYGTLAGRVAESLLRKEVSIKKIQRIIPILVFLKVATTSFNPRLIAKKLRGQNELQIFKVVAGSLIFLLWVAALIDVALGA